MKIIISVLVLLALIGLLILVGQQASEEPVRVTIAVPVTNQVSVAEVSQEPVRYFFDTDGHNAEEIKALLQRAVELHEDAVAAHRPMKIAMVMHGPDLEIFARKNYAQYAEIVDIAERLESSDVIDFKACQVAMESRGLKDSDMPEFFEMVPFGPEEIKQLEGDGYVRL